MRKKREKIDLQSAQRVATVSSRNPRVRDIELLQRTGQLAGEYRETFFYSRGSQVQDGESFR